MTKFNYFNLNINSAEFDEAWQQYEDFLARQAEEHQLMEMEKNNNFKQQQPPAGRQEEEK